LTVLIVLAILACIFGAMLIFGEGESVGMNSLPLSVQWIVMAVRNITAGAPLLL
jgi:hypothetical protein